jgi:hypothetical protein
MTATATRKPSPTQARELLAAIDPTDGRVAGMVSPVIGNTTRGALINAGWITDALQVTPAGYAAVGRATPTDAAPVATQPATPLQVVDLANRARYAPRVLREFRDLAKAAGVDARPGGWIYRSDNSRRPLARGWAEFAAAVSDGMWPDIARGMAVAAVERAGREVSLNGIKNARPTMRFTTEMLKGSPEYTITDDSGRIYARAHCVHVPNNLFTLVVDGKPAGVAPELNVVFAMQVLCGNADVSVVPGDTAATFLQRVADESLARVRRELSR